MSSKDYPSEVAEGKFSERDEDSYSDGKNYEQKRGGGGGGGASDKKGDYDDSDARGELDADEQDEADTKLIGIVQEFFFGNESKLV